MPGRQRADEPAVPSHALRPDRSDAYDHAYLRVRRRPSGVRHDDDEGRRDHQAADNFRLTRTPAATRVRTSDLCGRKGPGPCGHEVDGGGGGGGGPVDLARGRRPALEDNTSVAASLTAGYHR